MSEYQDEPSMEQVIEATQRYCNAVEDGLRERCNKTSVDLYDTAPHEVAGALIARQATLSIHFARSPGNWTGHVAPLFLRAMIDAHITLAWVLKERDTRAKKFILYGLGQEKLFIEHLKSKAASQEEDDEDLAWIIETREAWLNEQRRSFMTEVNVGSWSGLNTSEMAKESGLESLYKYAYAPFSGAAHSMWHHIERYNTQRCTNPLHKYHRTPAILSSGISPDFVYRSSKYVTLSFMAYDNAFGLTCETELPQDCFAREIGPLFSGDPEGAD